MGAKLKITFFSYKFMPEIITEEDFNKIKTDFSFARKKNKTDYSYVIFSLSIILFVYLLLYLLSYEGLALMSLLVTGFPAFFTIESLINYEIKKNNYLKNLKIRMNKSEVYIDFIQKESLIREGIDAENYFNN